MAQDRKLAVNGKLKSSEYGFQTVLSRKGAKAKNW